MTPRTLLLLLLLLPSPAHAWQVGAAPSTRKLLPAAGVPSAQVIRVAAARNEWEGFQIAINDPAGVAGVNVKLSDLCQTGGSPCIKSSRARLYRQVYLDIKLPSQLGVPLHERVPGLYPDPLIPFSDPYKTGDVPVGAPFSLKAGELGAVFVDLYVPDTATPGQYAGTATVAATGKSPVSIVVQLEVWDITMPRTRNVATAFGFSESLVRHYHGGAGSTPAAGYDDIVKRYYACLHEHRIDPTTVNGPVDFKFDSAGKLLPVDWTAYDKAVAPWMDGTKFGDGIPVTRFNVARFRPGHGQGSMTETQWQQGAKAFAEHLKAKGWWDRAYVYGRDEPWLKDAAKAYAQINKDIDLLFAASSLWKGKVLITGPYGTEIDDGKVGIWCPVTPMYEDWFWTWEPKAGWKTYTERFKKGEELWFYVCNANTPPYAGYDIDTAIGHEPRMVKWGTWFERATGFLFWRTNYWVDQDPWNVWEDIKTFTKTGARNGDGFLFYPGDHDGTAGGKGSPKGVKMDGPVPSYRLKQIRDGLEDWELLRMAAGLGAETYARQQVSRAYKRFGDLFLVSCTVKGAYCPEDQPWTLDENVLLDARDLVARKVMHLQNPARYLDPEKALARATPNPTPAWTPVPAGAIKKIPPDWKAGGGGCDVGEGGGAGGLLLMLLLVLGLRRAPLPHR